MPCATARCDRADDCSSRPGYGTRKIFPVYGSLASLFGGKPRTSIYPAPGEKGLVTKPGLPGTGIPYGIFPVAADDVVAGVGEGVGVTSFGVGLGVAPTCPVEGVGDVLGTPIAGVGLGITLGFPTGWPGGRCVDCRVSVSQPERRTMEETTKTADSAVLIAKTTMLQHGRSSNQIFSIPCHFTTPGRVFSKNRKASIGWPRSRKG